MGIHIVIPAKAGIQGGEGPGGMGPRLHGNDGRRRRTRAAAGAPTIVGRESTATHIVIPAKAGIHGGGPGRMGPRLHGNDGRTREAAGIHGHPYRHSRDGGNPWRGGAGGDGSPSPRERRTHPGGGGNPRPPISSFPRRRESMAGGRGWVPVSTGTTMASTSSFPRQREGGDGFPSPRERRAHPHSRDDGGGAPTIVCGNPRPPYRHSREGGNPRPPISSFPRRRESMAGRGRGGWVPVSTGTTMGIHIVIPATAGGRRWVPACTATTDAPTFPRRRRRRTHNRLRESTAPISSFPRRRESTATTSSFPRRRESMAGGRADGSPSPRERRWASTSSFPRQREGGDGFPSPRERRAHPHRPRDDGGGAPTMVCENPGPHIVPAEGGNPRPPHRHSREGGNPRPPISSFPRRRESTAPMSFPRQGESMAGGRADGSPSPRERRTHPGGGGNPRPPISSFPRRRESMAGRGRGMGPRLHGDDDGHPHRHSRDSGRAGMGSRLHGNDGGHPQSSFPATAGGRGMGSRLHGNRRAHPYRHSREGGNPWRGGAGGDGSPSPRGRRWASTSSFPRRRGGGDGFPPARERRLYNGPSPRERRWAQRAPTIVGGRSSCPWRGSGGTLCCRPTS